MSRRHRETGDGKSELPRHYYSLPRRYASQEETNSTKDLNQSSRHQFNTSSTYTPSSASSTHSSGRRIGSLRSQKTTDSAHEPYSSHRSGLRTQGLSSGNVLRKAASTESSNIDNESRLPGSSGRSSSLRADSATSRNRSLAHSNSESSVTSERGSRRQYSLSGEHKDSPFNLTRKKSIGSSDVSLDDMSGSGTHAPKTPDSSVPYSTRSEAKRCTSSESDATIRLSRKNSSDELVAGDSNAANLNGSTEKSSKEEKESTNKDQSTIRDISLLSREITSAYEGSLTRRYSDKRQVKKHESPASFPGEEPECTTTVTDPLPVTKSDEKSADTLAYVESSEQTVTETVWERKADPTCEGAVEPGQKQISHGTQFKRAFSHRRSFSDGSHHFYRPEDSVPEKAAKKGFFSHRKMSDSEILETVPSKQSKRGLFSRRSSSSSREDSEGEEKGDIVSKRKQSVSAKLFGSSVSSSDSKGNKDASKKTFSVPSKFFPSKDSDNKGKGTCGSPEATRKEFRKRRVSLPGKFGFSRSSSLDHTGNSEPADPPVDDALHARRVKPFKRAATFDCDTDKSKSSVLHRLKFWDKKERNRVLGRRSSYSVASSPGQDRQISSTEGSPDNKASDESLSSKRPFQLGRFKERKRSNNEESDAGMEDKEAHGITEELRQQMQPCESKHSGSRHEKGTRVTEREAQKDGNSGDLPVSLEQMTEEAGQPSSALTRLRERRRRRRMVREQLLAPLQSDEVKNTRRTSVGRKDSSSVDTLANKKVVGGKNEPFAAPERKPSGTKREKTFSLEGNTSSKSKVEETDAVDGDHRNGLIKNGRHISSEIKENQRNRRQLGEIGKKLSEDYLTRKQSNDLKPRHRTIASTEHTNIIASLLRDGGRTSHQPEVLFPSVSQLRAKFIAGKAGSEILRINSKTEERPHSIGGETLSPTELKKFDDITFSLERKDSTKDVTVANKMNVSGSVHSKEPTKLVKQVSTSSHTSGPKCDPKENLAKIAVDDTKSASIVELSTDPGRRSTSPEAEFKKVEQVSTGSRTSGPKCDPKENLAKKAVDDTKSANTVEPSIDPGRRSTSPEAEFKKSRGSKKKRKKSIFGSEKDHKTSKESTEDQGENSQPVKVSGLKGIFARRGSSSMSRPKALAVGLKSELLRKASEMTQRRETYDEMVNGEMQSNQKIPEVHVVNSESTPTMAKKDKKAAKNEERKHTGEQEKKSLKKASKTRKEKRIFKSSLRPFGLTGAKSESNLFQPKLDYVAVEISLDDNKAQNITNTAKGSNVSAGRIQVPSSPVTSPTESKKGSSTLLEEGLSEFFGDSKATESGRGPKLEITLDDLDLISGKSSEQLKCLTEDKLKVKPKRRHAGSGNPIKNLQNRKDVRTGTDEPEKPKMGKKPLTNEDAVIRRRKKTKDPANLWRRHTMVDLSASAIAGLESTEDFTKVRLRKTAGPEEKEKNEYNGTKPIMLVHIKGRRCIQTRLIEPCKKALNSGDCFVLVTPTDIFAWIGKEANTVERAKVTEISSRVVAKRELNCKAKEVVFIEEKDGENSNPKFWKILNAESDADIRGPDSLPRDEEYEKGLIKSNMVYKVHWTEPPHLMPVEEMCGCLPQFGILDTKEVFVFDFGSELYVWNGQQSLSAKRKTVFALARQLYDEPFKVNGLYDSVFPYGKANTDTETAKCRPAWTMFAQLHERAETILFREKFLDWPDPTKIIKMKGHPSSGELLAPPPPVELMPCDPRFLHKPSHPLTDHVLGGTNVGRGNGVKTVWIGDHYKEGNLVTTVKRTVWHINEYRHFELPQASVGHFYSGEGYVIRWEFFVLNDRIATDRRSRCRSTVAGRVRTAYFFWQGNDCSVNEKGAAAVMAVELDEEQGPQIRVVQGKEPPMFLNLFKAGMIIHRGRREHQDEMTEKIQDTATIRLYVVRNEQPGEACLVQVTANSFSLRSRCSFVLLLCNEAHIYVWHGAKSTEDLRSGAKVAAKAIQDRKPAECNVANVSAITVEEIEESSEPDEFWEALGGKKYYCTLANEPDKHIFVPRLFELSSTTGKFTGIEVLCPSRSENKICAFPFLQEDMYAAYQPVLFLLDGHSEVYIWEGWKPKDDGTGSGQQRWDKDRQLAMETALNYTQVVDKRVAHRVFLVHAGLEPMSFKALFPYWNDRPDVTKLQKEEGKHAEAKYSVKELLLKFTKEFYPLTELQRIPPPQGVDPAKLETYLSDQDFQEIFEMTKEELHKLPGWKQMKMKKKVGLF